MQLIQKHGIVLSGLAVFLFLGYIAIQHPDSSQTDEAKVHTGTNISISQSGIETDTGKRLETIANSGTQWGISPFGSGKPLEEEKKQEFKKPNTEWKTRTLSGITYVFGEGNPREVALTLTGIEKLNADCNDPIHMEGLSKKGFCNVAIGIPNYLTSQVEKTILAALTHNNWKNLYNECESSFRYVDQQSPNRPVYEFTFDRVFYQGLLDINNFIEIDIDTGLKMLNLANIAQLIFFLERGKQFYGESTNPYGDCVDQYAIKIIELLESARGQYMIKY